MFDWPAVNQTSPFSDYSRGVFAIDWLLSLVGVIGSRSALRVFRDSLAALAGRPRKALLLGDDAVRVVNGLLDEGIFQLGQMFL